MKRIDRRFFPVQNERQRVSEAERDEKAGYVYDGAVAAGHGSGQQKPRRGKRYPLSYGADKSETERRGLEDKLRSSEHISHNAVCETVYYNGPFFF